MKFGIIDFMMASLQVAFIVMKLCGAISWSWWLVMLPILLVEVFNVLVLFLYVSQRDISRVNSSNSMAPTTSLPFA